MGWQRVGHDWMTFTSPDNWPASLCYFQVHNIVSWCFCMLQKNYHDTSRCHLSPYRYSDLIDYIPQTVPFIPVTLFSFFNNWKLLPLNFLYPFHPPTPLPSGNHLFVLCIYKSILFSYIFFFVLYFRFHIQVKSNSICFSLTYFT